jgi:hypothetical protein
LKNIPTVNKIIPIGNQMAIQQNRQLISVTSKVPISIIKQIPNNINPEKGPLGNISILLRYTLNRLLAAKIYSAIDNTSIPKKNIAKFPKKPWLRFQPIKYFNGDLIF